MELLVKVCARSERGNSHRNTGVRKTGSDRKTLTAFLTTLLTPLDALTFYGLTPA
jgi:hypothetical protein